MAKFVVTAVRLGPDGEVTYAKFARVAESDVAPPMLAEELHVVEVDRVVEAFDRGDFVFTTFETQGHKVVGPRLLRKVLPNGRETLRMELEEKDRTLRDLPRC